MVSSFCESFKPDLVLIRLKQISHWKGFCFPCIAMLCESRYFFELKCFPQMSHLNICIALWTALMCLFRLLVVPNADWQTLHLCGLSWLWTVLIWIFKSPVLVKCLSQVLQANLLFSWSILQLMLMFSLSCLFLNLQDLY